MHQDSLNSTSLVTDSNGSLLGSTTFYPFGSTRAGSVPTDEKFTGQRLDGTGLYYYNARYYDPAIGRFISADTTIPDFRNPQAFNRYSYVVNNPLKWIDPTGHALILPPPPDDETETYFPPPPGVEIPESLVPESPPIDLPPVQSHPLTPSGMADNYGGKPSDYVGGPAISPSDALGMADTYGGKPSYYLGLNETYGYVPYGLIPTYYREDIFWQQFTGLMEVAGGIVIAGAGALGFFASGGASFEISIPAMSIGVGLISQGVNTWNGDYNFYIPDPFH